MNLIDTQARVVDLEKSFLETGMFGDGSDGAVIFDGTTAVLGLVPSASAYTLNRSIFCSSITINGSVKIKTAGYKIFCTGTLTNNGTITNEATLGGNASGSGAVSARSEERRVGEEGRSRGVS